MHFRHNDYKGLAAKGLKAANPFFLPKQPMASPDLNAFLNWHKTHL